jgi:hypothetical protein
MKKLILTIAITLSLVSGFSIVSAAEMNNTTSSATTSTGRYSIKVYEDGAIWVYVYESDGTYVTKYEEIIN